MGDDVAVVGLGAMGSLALWRLAARGARVVGFEQFAPGHDQGSSHGESRIIRTAYMEDPRYVPLVQSAFRIWRDLEAASGAPLLTATGALMIGRPGSAVVAGTRASAETHGLAHTVLDTAAMRARFPQHRLAPGEIGVYEDAGGVLRPEAAIAAAVGVAERLGARVHRHTRVDSVEPAGDGVVIRAGGATYRARHAVVSAGPWLGTLLPELGLPLHVERQVLAWFPVPDPAAFAPGRFPVFIREALGDHSYYGLPTLDGATIKLGLHHAGAATTPDTVDRGVTPADLAPLQEYVRTCLAGVGPAAVRAKVCLYTNTPDEHFLVGAPSGWPALTILGGFSGHGFKFASVLGEVAADLALTGTTTHPIGLFALDRFSATRAPAPPSAV